TLREQVVGPDTSALSDRISEAYADLRTRYQVRFGDPAGTLYATLIGYRVDRYADDEVHLRLLTEGPGRTGQPVLAATAVTLLWQGGDWVLLAPPLGDFSTVMAPVP